MAKYEVAIGKAFAVDGVKIKSVSAVERLAAVEERRAFARDQSRLTYAVLSVFVIALSLAAVLGWRDGTYDELYTVWAGGGFWAGLVLGRYFKKD